MNRLYKRFISLGEPKNALEYIKKWECFVSLKGIYNTIEYTEPNSTKKIRKNIKKIIESNKNNYAFYISIKRVKSLKYEKKIYDAYKNKTLPEFIKKNREKLIKKNIE